MYGAGLDNEFYAALCALPAKTRFLPLISGANAVGAARLGLSVRSVQGHALYVLAGDEKTIDDPLPPAEFTVVQAAYRTPWVDQADVALPAEAPFEMRGHILNMERRRLAVLPAVPMPAGVLPSWTTLFLLSVKMGRPLTCMTVADFSGSEV